MYTPLLNEGEWSEGAAPAAALELSGGSDKDNNDRACSFAGNDSAVASILTTNGAGGGQSGPPGMQSKALLSDDAATSLLTQSELLLLTGASVPPKEVSKLWQAEEQYATNQGIKPGFQGWSAQYNKARNHFLKDAAEMLGEDSLTRANNSAVWTACDLYARTCTRLTGRLKARDGYQGGLDALHAEAQDAMGGEEESVRGNSTPETSRGDDDEGRTLRGSDEPTSRLIKPYGVTQGSDDELGMRAREIASYLRWIENLNHNQRAAHRATLKRCALPEGDIDDATSRAGPEFDPTAALSSDAAWRARLKAQHEFGSLQSAGDQKSMSLRGGHQKSDRYLLGLVEIVDRPRVSYTRGPWNTSNNYQTHGIQRGGREVEQVTISDR